MRRARRAVVAAAVLAAVGLVPRASAAGDPADPGSASAPDPFGNAQTGQQCAAKLINPPAGFEAPAGIPALAPCGITKLATGTTTVPQGTNYTGVGTLGLQGAPRVAQWVKIPTALSVAVVPIHAVQYAVGTAPAQEPANTTNVFYFYPQVWFLSADHKRVGEMPPFRVRTLAFGSIPVEVTVHILQPHNSDGSVEPINVSQENPTTNVANGFPGGNKNLNRDAHGSGRVSVRISDVRIDTTPVDVGSDCATPPGLLRVFGAGYLSATAGVVPAGKYNGASGGLLTGTVDIGAFSGCRTPSGDDLSAVFTNAISGQGNPISINQTRSSTACYPLYNVATCQQPLAPLTVPTTRPQPRSAPAS